MTSVSSANAVQNALKHPLQRLHSPSRTLSLSLHAVGLYDFAKCFEYLHAHPNRINQSYGWHFQFLTILGLLIATIAFATGVLADMIGSKTLFKIKNALVLIAAPLEALITLLYWSLHFYDRTLLVDPKVAPQLPLLMDLGFHFFPTMLLMVDTLFFSPPWETHALSALMIFSVFAGGYWIWVEHCFTHNNFYPYPLMGMLNHKQRLLLFSFATLLCWSGFLTVRELYRMLNGEIEAYRSRKKKI